MNKEINLKDAKGEIGYESAVYHLKESNLLICDYKEIQNILNFKKPIWLGESSPSGFDAVYPIKYHPNVHIYVYKNLHRDVAFIKVTDIIKIQK